MVDLAAAAERGGGEYYRERPPRGAKSSFLEKRARFTLDRKTASQPIMALCGGVLNCLAEGVLLRDKSGSVRADHACTLALHEALLEFGERVGAVSLVMSGSVVALYSVDEGEPYLDALPARACISHVCTCTSRVCVCR